MTEHSLVTERVPASKCPSCGAVHNAATGMMGARNPEPGDITVCWTCGHIMAWGADMQFRELTEEEILAVAGDKRFLAIQKARELSQREKKKQK